MLQLQYSDLVSKMFAKNDIWDFIKSVSNKIGELKFYESKTVGTTGAFPNIITDKFYQRIFSELCDEFLYLSQSINVDIDGKSPFKKYNVELSADFGGSDAAISIDRGIEINYLFLYKMYLMEPFFFYKVREIPNCDSDPARLKLLSMSLGVDESAIRKAIYIINHESVKFFEDEKSRWSFAFRFFGIVNFIVCHELAHLVCGHFSLSNEIDTNHKMSNPDDPFDLKNWTIENSRSWAREFCCDMYASTRGMLCARALEGALGDGRTYVNVMSGGTVVIACLSNGVFETHDTHPSAFARTLAHLTAILNCVSPVSNAFSGFRPSYIPWEIEYDENGYGVLTSSQWMILSETYDRAMFGLSVLNGVNLSALADDEFKKQISTCPSLWRIGYGQLPEDIDLISDDNVINNILKRASFEFYSGMRDLCTMYNMNYASSFPSGMMSELSLSDCIKFCENALFAEGRDFYTRTMDEKMIEIMDVAFLRGYPIDPAYQSLDAIFSNIQFLSEPRQQRVDGLSKNDEFEALKKFGEMLVYVGSINKQA